MILHLFPSVFWAIIIVLAPTPFAIALANYLELIDYPNSFPHKVHQKRI
jgi:hypothetical protein